MEKTDNLKVGDVVQLNPEFHLGDKRGFFGGCFMVVSELKAFGAQGYVSMPAERGAMPGQAYYRAKWEEMEPVGKATWVVGSAEEHTCLSTEDQLPCKPCEDGK